jgi:hypothetical protein
MEAEQQQVLDDRQIAHQQEVRDLCSEGAKRSTMSAFEEEDQEDVTGDDC